MPLRSRRAFGLLALAGYAGLGLACVALGLLTFLIVASPVDLVRDRVVERLKATTGRELHIAGATSVAFLPRPAVSVGNVSLASLPDRGSTEAATVEIERIDIELGLSSLLGGEPLIRRVVLVRPRIALSSEARGQDAAGAAQDPAGRRPAGEAKLPQTLAAASARSALALKRSGLESVGIIDGSLREAGSGQGISAITTDVTLSAGAGAVGAKGSLVLRGETLAFEAGLSSLGALLEEEKASVTLKLKGAPIEATFVGELETGGAASLEGRLTLSSSSAHALAAWLGEPLAGVSDPAALTLAGTMRVEEGRISLSAMEASLGGTGLTGEVTLERRGARAHLSGALRLAELNIGRLLLRPMVAARNVSPPPGKGEPEQGAGPVPTAKRADGEWSDDLIELSSLALADADLMLSVERIAYKEVTTGPSRLRLAVENGFAKLTLLETALYDGRGRGVVTLDGTNKTPAIGANLELEGISALPLLKDALGFEWLEGSGAIAVALAGQGASVRQVVSGLNGKVTVSLGNGAIRGIDVAKILRNVEQGRFEGPIAAAGEKTQFSEFAGTFLITSGLAQNQDLRLISQRLQLSGAGTIGLGRRTLDYTAKTRILAGSPTPGPIAIGNLEIPLHIEGPWAKPNVSVFGQENLAATVKQIGKNLNSQEVRDAIKGLFGDGPRTKPSELLDKLLKKEQ